MNNLFIEFNEIITYIENNLTEEIDYKQLGKIVGYSPYHLQRLFLMITNIPISEYIRNRRLSCSAYDLLNDNNSVTDIAYKYGYSSPTSFNRAFKAFHGVTPRDIKKQETFIKAYPPLSFELSIKGANSINYKIVNTESFRIVGKKLHTTMEGGKSYGELPIFWQKIQQTDDVPKLLSLMNKEPFGLLGVSDYNPSLEENAFDYYIGVSTNCEQIEGYDELVIPETTWATFPHHLGSPEEMQQFQKQIVMEWLPTSGYQFAFGPDLEVYGQDNTVETWIPVSKLHKN